MGGVWGMEEHLLYNWSLKDHPLYERKKKNTKTHRLRTIRNSKHSKVVKYDNQLEAHISRSMRIIECR